MPLKLVEAATEDVVTLEEAKASLRVDYDDKDDLIQSLIDAAVEHVQKQIGRALVSQVWDYWQDAFPDSGDVIEIPLPPLIEVVGLFYSDGSGNEQEMDASGYVVDAASTPARISSSSWPSAGGIINAVRVRFRAGYVDPQASPETQAVPTPIKHAVLLYVGDWFAFPQNFIVGQTVDEIPAAQRLLALYNANRGFA